jgi:hypothetical protein
MPAFPGCASSASASAPASIFGPSMAGMCRPGGRSSPRSIRHCGLRTLPTRAAPATSTTPTASPPGFRAPTGARLSAGSLQSRAVARRACAGAGGGLDPRRLGRRGPPAADVENHASADRPGPRRAENDAARIRQSQPADGASPDRAARQRSQPVSLQTALPVLRPRVWRERFGHLAEALPILRRWRAWTGLLTEVRRPCKAFTPASSLQGNDIRLPVAVGAKCRR